MSTTTQIETTRAVTVSRGKVWALLGASFWMLLGLQLDAYAHANVAELETFWTPWHAVMYSGIFASCLVGIWILRPFLPEGLTVAGLKALPLSLKVSATGMVLLLISGGVDTLWHNLFGIEDGLDIFMSPSHVGIITGMAAVAFGPVLMRWEQPDNGTLSASDRALVATSLILAMLSPHIYSLHASVLNFPAPGTGLEETTLDGLDAVWLHGYLWTTVLLLIPVLVWARRWQLPLGIPTVLAAVPSVLMWLAFGDPSMVWYPALMVGGMAAAEVCCRAGAQFVHSKLSRDAAWIAAGALAPFVLWGTLLLGMALILPEAIPQSWETPRSEGEIKQLGYGWNIHATTGLLTETALTGALVAAISRWLNPGLNPGRVPTPSSG
jgi:hypothetical protein